MTKSTYPLIEKLGIEITNPYNTVSYSGQIAHMIKASDLERLLESLPVYYKNPVSGSWHEDDYTNAEDSVPDTHTARFLLIEEIKRESAEDLLRKIVELRDEAINHGGHPMFEAIRQAKLFLEREKEREGL